VHATDDHAMKARAYPLLDALVFSNLWTAAAMSALVAASFRAMDVAIAPEAVGLAFSGTLVIYNLDRLRDLGRDRCGSPDRSAFVSAHESRLVGLATVAAAVAVFFAARAGAWAVAVLLPALGLGLFHRRLKRFENAKIFYIAASWTCVGFGLPAVVARSAHDLGWVAAIVSASLFANVCAFNVRDERTGAARIGRPRALWVARLCAGFGIALGAFAPFPANTVVAIPLATLLALLAYRPSERFSPLFVDGALLVGSLVAAALA
jgi:hypothetical protein